SSGAGGRSLGGSNPSETTRSAPGLVSNVPTERPAAPAGEASGVSSRDSAAGPPGTALSGTLFGLAATPPRVEPAGAVGQRTLFGIAGSAAPRNAPPSASAERWARPE